MLLSDCLSGRWSAVGISYKHYSHLNNDDVVCCTTSRSLSSNHIPTFLLYLHSVLHILHKKHVNHHCDIFVAFVVFIYMLLSFVKFQVKLMNFDGMSKDSAAISNFLISQRQCGNTVKARRKTL